MAKWQRFRVEIPKDYKPVERVAIAQEIIEHIINRSQKGFDVNNDPFPTYTKEYKDSKNFKIAGKGSKPNLTLSGEMLNNIELISHKSGSMLIGFDRGDSELNGKAEGNQIGSYGKKSGDPDKAREFLGISEDDLDDILKKYPKDDENKKTTRQKAIELVSTLQEVRGSIDS